MKNIENKFFVYILKTSSDTLYIGQTNNLERRIKEHKSKSSRSARYLRYFDDCSLVYFETFSTRREAMLREVKLKSWPRSRKEKLISTNSGENN